MVIDRCMACPRRCGARRDEKTAFGGFCGMPANPRLARAALHFGEEPCISGRHGSGTVFFSGCSLSCAFCQNYEISHKQYGETVTVNRLAAIFRELEQLGAENINLVNPTHFAAAVREALLLYKPHIPVIYNTGGYERVETLRSLEGLVDVYLPDLKYVHTELSKALSGAADYFAFAAPAILEMARQTGPVVLDENGMIQRGTMVRHLVLPGHTRESMAVLDWLSQYRERFFVSLMFQYTPMRDIDGYPALSRSLTRRECDKVWAYMDSLGITDGYVQSRKSTGTDMIPDFDLTGIETGE